MPNTSRITVSVRNERATRVRELVEAGKYESISSAFDAAIGVLLERQAREDEWWAETIRRCDEAESHPERLLDPDTFFRQVRADIARLPKSRS